MTGFTVDSLNLPAGGDRITPTVPAKSAVFLTHSSFSSPFRVGSHQLTKVLDGCGWRVLHVPTPVTPAHFPLGLFKPEYRSRIAQAGGRLQPLFERSGEYIPLAWLPWQMARLAGRHGPALYAGSQFTAARHIQRAGFARPDLLFVDEPRMIAMARWFKPRRSFYRATDLYHEMKGDSSVLVAERRALMETDAFIATSSPVYEHLRKMAPDKPGLLLENGVELDHFVRPVPLPADLQRIPAPRATYVGAIDDRFDFAATISLARQRPGVSLVLIGPCKTGGAESALPSNVHLLGSRPYETIPAYMQHSTVGLLPLTAHRANRGRSPMKIYEYGAAGLPVLASQTDELARRNLSFVTLYETAEQMPKALDATLALRPVLSARAIQAAQAMSWNSRLDEIMRFSARLPA